MERLIEDRFKEWQELCDRRFEKLRANEEELNRIFIKIYGLETELSPQVAEKDVSIRRADLSREIRSLISYAVGCLFGRYSIDHHGLCCTGRELDMSLYSTIVPCIDNVIPLQGKDCLTERIIDFISIIYGSDKTDENLAFIAGALGGKGTPKEVLDCYLRNDFFPDHCKIYQKRPIYWLFSAGKKSGFKALCYIHRWNSGTLSALRESYVQTALDEMKKELNILAERPGPTSSAEKSSLKKRLDSLHNSIEELRRFQEKLSELPEEIDLDDGIKNNYSLFQSVLERIK